MLDEDALFISDNQSFWRLPTCLPGFELIDRRSLQVVGRFSERILVASSFSFLLHLQPSSQPKVMNQERLSSSVSIA